MDRIDEDKFLELYGDALGISPKILRDDDATNKIRDEKAKQAQQQAQAQQAQQLAAAGKDASQAQPDSDNLLGKALGA